MIRLDRSWHDVDAAVLSVIDRLMVENKCWSKIIDGVVVRNSMVPHTDPPVFEFIADQRWIEAERICFSMEVKRTFRETDWVI